MAKIVQFNSLDLDDQLRALRSVAKRTKLSIINLITKVERINPPVSIYQSGNIRISSVYFRNTS